MKKKPLSLMSLVIVIGYVLFTLFFGNEAPSSPQTASALIKATIERVVDGDTLILSTGERLRLIGLNAPENTSRTEAYGKEASQFVRETVEGRTVWLQQDVSDTDQYDRLLRYVWLMKTPDYEKIEKSDPDYIIDHMLNAILLNEGYAEPYTFPPDVMHQALFLTLAKDARKAQRGLWAIDPQNGTTRGDMDQ